MTRPLSVQSRLGASVYRPESCVTITLPPPSPWWRAALDNIGAGFWSFMAYVVGPILPIVGAVGGYALADLLL